MFVSSAVYAGIPFTHGNLKVDGSGRYLEHDDGTPFLYMGDTAWEMKKPVPIWTTGWGRE